jgi:hypothetical protein
LTAEHEKERQRAIARVADHGWREGRTNPRSGYTKMLCACGKHIVWLPKTPSNRDTYRRKASHMISMCSTHD